MNYPPIQCLHGLYWRCEACGTLTRTDDCDCTKMNTDTQRLVPLTWISESELKAMRAINAELVEACLWLKIYAEVQVRNHPDATDTPDWQRLLVALAKAQEQK